MLIRFDNVWASIAESTPTEEKWVLRYLSCEDDRYQPNRAMTFMGAEDRVYCMLDRIGNIFPAGLLHNLRGAAKSAGINVEVEDQREIVCAIDLDQSRVSWLRDYQWDAVQAAARRGRGLIDAPTASGKSEMFIALTRVLACEWLFLVHRTDLVGQIAARYTLRTGETAGTFVNGEWSPGTCNVTAATFQAVYAAMIKKKRKKPVAPNRGIEALLQRTEAMFVDEVHAVNAETYYSVALALTRAYYRFGASATCLDKSDRENMRTMAATGPFVYRISHQLLVKRGILAKSVVRMVSCSQWGEPQWGWPAVYRNLISTSEKRNEVLAEMIQRAKKPCLCFVNHTKHGRNLLPKIKAAGLSVVFAYGSRDSLEMRRAKIRELERGQVDVLLCTVIFQEGVDIPCLRSVVVGAGESSVVAAIQRRGRGTRREDGAGGDEFELWDVLDTGQRWLEKHARKRREAYESRGDIVQIGWPG